MNTKDQYYQNVLRNIKISIGRSIDAGARLPIYFSTNDLSDELFYKLVDELKDKGWEIVSSAHEDQIGIQ